MGLLFNDVYWYENVTSTTTPCVHPFSRLIIVIQLQINGRSGICFLMLLIV